MASPGGPPRDDGAAIVVTGVVPGGPAEACGVRPLDLVVALNGDPVAPGTDRDAFLAALAAAPRPLRLSFRFARLPGRPDARGVGV